MTFFYVESSSEAHRKFMNTEMADAPKSVREEMEAHYRADNGMDPAGPDEPFVDWLFGRNFSGWN